MSKYSSVVGETEASSIEVGVDTPKCINHGLPPSNQGNQNDLYTELWRACAGPLVYVPRVGERVFYFPQGHMEQVVACTNEDGMAAMPIYNLPYKILCNVVRVELKAETGTDEVFAHITLLPVAEQDELSSNEDGNSPSLLRKSRVQSFTKKLTPSDTCPHGGFSVPKRHADECLPPLLVVQDASHEPPQQVLLAKDLHGSEWCFRHIYRGQPKRHLLTRGWSTFLSSKRLAPGDAFILLRGESGELRVGVRRAMKLENNSSTTVVSAHSMQHGILASAFHAICSGTVFTVYFHPWSSPAEYIIPFDQYMKSAEIEYSNGTRFRMLFESEECAEQRIERFEGTIIGIEDVDHIRWPHSEWRILKVKWDAVSEAFVPPERVSPWNIEPIEPKRKKHTSLPHQKKRACVLGFFHRPIEYPYQILSEVFQGQENRDMGVNGLDTLKPPIIPHLISPPNRDWNGTPYGQDNQVPFCVPHHPFFLCPSNTVSFPSGNLSRPGLPNSWYATLSCYGNHDNAIGSRNVSAPNVNSHNYGLQNWRHFELKHANEFPLAGNLSRSGLPNSEFATLSRYGNHDNAIGSRNVSAPYVDSHNYGLQNWRHFELKHANEVPLPTSDNGGKCMLFGVNLVSNPPELPSLQVATSTLLETHHSVSLTSQSSVSEPSRSKSGSHSGKQSKNCCSATNRSCTKVLKYGTAIGRTVDLTQFDGYNELIGELDLMFEFNGSLINGTSGWYVVYSDDERDIMLVGDCPWQEFQFMVQRMFIYPKEEIGKLNPSSPTS